MSEANTLGGSCGRVPGADRSQLATGTASPVGQRDAYGQDKVDLPDLGGETRRDAYGGKAFLDIRGEPIVAELAMLKPTKVCG
jgi:hypothetical protein